MAASIEVKFEGLRSEAGSIGYLLFQGEEGFPDKDHLSVRKGTLSATDKTLKIDDLPEGQYAMTFLHDENGNGKMDKKLGFPEEGFGFSENPIIFFGPPSFKRSSFELQNRKTLTIKMKYL